LTHTGSGIERRGNAEPAFDLYREGSLVGTYPISKIYYEGIPSAAGAHEIRSSSTYAIGNMTGSTEAVFSFNTNNTDANPPLMGVFRIEQNGIRTATPFYPAPLKPATVKFLATDGVFGAISSVSVEWRQNGSTTWTSLPLTVNGAAYDAAVHQQGAIDLRVTITDTAGNTTEETWRPAFITTAPPPPPAPASITATRSGATSIAISWPDSPSPIGIAGYRIERFPDNQIITTTGTDTTAVDSSGLLADHAYFYRVFAIDTNNVLSVASSPYDIASLVEIHDDPVVTGLTPVRGIHVGELRHAVDSIRRAVGLSDAWTNYAPLAGLVLSSHFTGLRDSLNVARGALQLSPVQFSHEVGPGTQIRARDVQDLRDAAK
jgi:hypothetical protein